MRTQKEGTCKYIYKYKYTCAAHRDESASVSDESKHDELCHSHGTPEQHMKMQKCRKHVNLFLRWKLFSHVEVCSFVSVFLIT